MPNYYSTVAATDLPYPAGTKERGDRPAVARTRPRYYVCTTYMPRASRLVFGGEVMQPELFTPDAHIEAITRVEEALAANIEAVADCMRDERNGVEGTGKRLNQLNTVWYHLQEAHHKLTGIDPVPYRMKR